VIQTLVTSNKTFKKKKRCYKKAPLLFTHDCYKKNKRVKYWLPTSVDNPPFGTTYENLIYHEMQIRKQSNHENFIKKCKLVLEEL
jgi:hypothetical protein